MRLLQNEADRICSMNGEVAKSYRILSGRVLVEVYDSGFVECPGLLTRVPVVSKEIAFIFKGRGFQQEWNSSQPLKMEVLRSFETSGTTNPGTQLHIPENLNYL
jgi:hypothetical protein